MKRAIALAAALTISAASGAYSEDIYPQVLDASHATPEVAAFFTSFFVAKSKHEAVPTTDHFSDAHLTYIDAVLGWPFYEKKGMTDLFTEIMPKWPATGLSYPTAITGDMNSALVQFTDTPELFGGEIRIIAAVDMKDGKVVRWVDYWDGRSFGTATAAAMRTPADKFPTNFDYDVSSDGASAKIKDASQKLNAAFVAGDSAAAAALFATDAVFQDRALRVRLLGPQAIGQYLARALPKVPYGKGAQLRHVVGSDQGGGYEWTNDGATVTRGIVAIDLDAAGKIESLDATWDNGIMGDEELQALVLLSIEE